jgi:hypothetical protein
MACPKRSTKKRPKRSSSHAPEAPAADATPLRLPGLAVLIGGDVDADA